MITCKVGNTDTTIGDSVGFKSDCEQEGEVIEISRRHGRTYVTLSNEDGFEGGYIGGQTEAEVDVTDCWLV